MTDLVPLSNNKHAITDPQSLEAVGQQANRIAEQHIFDDYRMRRAQRTIQTQAAGLIAFAGYLRFLGVGDSLFARAAAWAEAFYSEPQRNSLAEYAEKQVVELAVVFGGYYLQHIPAGWQNITWGLIESFVKWMLNEGYSIATVNNRLSTVKVYARLATQAGVIPPTEHALIREVRGYGLTEGKRVNERRKATRRGFKKEEAIVLTADQAKRLKQDHPPTPQGIRDRLLMCLFLDLGLRASEVAGLQVADLAETDYIHVYRQKTDSDGRMRLSPDLREALRDYAPFLRESGVLLRGSRKNGKLTDNIMSVRAIGNRVKLLGRDILGEWELSPHDLRHTWATRAAKFSNPFTLRDAGGWTNMETPGRYVERASVVNEGIELDY